MIGTDSYNDIGLCLSETKRLEKRFKQRVNIANWKAHQIKPANEILPESKCLSNDLYWQDTGTCAYTYLSVKIQLIQSN